MKHLSFLLLLLFFVLSLQAQTGTFDKLNLRSSLKLKDALITEISSDTTLQAGSDFKLPTQRAIKKFIENAQFIKRSGNGIQKDDDSLSIGGYYSGIVLTQETDNASLQLDNYLSFRGRDAEMNKTSVLSVGGGAFSVSSNHPGGLSEFRLIDNELKFEQNSIEKIKVDGDGFVGIHNLKLPGSLILDVFRLPMLDGSTEISYGNNVVILENINVNKTLVLPAPTTYPGRAFFLFNANTTTFNYNLNLPIYKSGTATVTTIPGNTEFRAIIMSDGLKWIQLN